jgi:hypothetical protein
MGRSDPIGVAPQQFDHDAASRSISRHRGKPPAVVIPPIEENHMLNRRAIFGLLASAATFAATGASFAKGPHHHINGHDLLGAKLKQNGKHEMGKAGKETVIAEVNNGKVTGMSAGSLPVKKVKTNKKMAQSGPMNIHLAAYGDVQLAQLVEIYYGYCIDTGMDEYYYWYLAGDVIITDGWIEYVPA